ncbi:DUF1957 domain-containing protein [Entomospira entomophila]|uniref:DUF1957 domain-containing protein n=1 Tax=Entomospira entomophila TaxID=2719988 RepID=A0A968GB89_9SPIO|nr:1,4-alpha-glucan branching protein domain-containing protein [Entomospira entomophilus]NIZ41200.1 DUF1957 domain-containing protein [Entomospira entomophilus]WDI35406.1 DUF1957 domain-containing protein [Entomospira entomophilus]
MTQREKKGSVIFCFNAHLPFAKFIQSGEVFQERWFFEAMLESYLPAYQGFMDLAREKQTFSVLLSLSPTLMTLLQSEDLQTKFVFYMHQKLLLAKQEVERKAEKHDYHTAVYYANQIQKMIHLYKALGGDLLNALKNAQKLGYCEIITSAATMAFLPLFATFEVAVEAQIITAIRQYRDVFGCMPRGFFLPYGGYYPGLEQILQRHGLKYFISAGQSLLQGTPVASMGVFYPIRVQDSEMVAFPRYSVVDGELWAEDGFAQRDCYRNFYHEEAQSTIVIKAGFQEYSSFFSHDIIHLEGFKYASNADSGEGAYILEEAFTQARTDARSFMERRCEELEAQYLEHKKPGIILMVIDLELLGHRWFEGIEFIQEAYRFIHQTTAINTTVPQVFLKRSLQLSLEEVALHFASWGNFGYGQVWLDQHNDWLVRYTFKAIEQMIDLANRFPLESGLKRRVLDQAAREVLLAMAGDWPLLIAQRVNEHVALHQVKKHLHYFTEICDAMSCNALRAAWLTEMERENDIFKFKSFSYKIFSTSHKEK